MDRKQAPREVTNFIDAAFTQLEVEQNIGVLVPSKFAKKVAPFLEPRFEEALEG